MDEAHNRSSAMLRLPHKRIALLPLESATSFASRLASLKGAPSLADWCADVEIARRGLAIGKPHDIERLAKLGEIDQNVLAHHAVVAMPREGVRFFGHESRRSAINLSQIRACPACLREDLGPSQQALLQMHGRIVWQFTSFRICPSHGLKLVTLKSRGIHDHHGAFKANLNQVLSGALDDPSPHAPVLEAHLVSRMRGEDPGNWLGRFRPDAVARISEVLGTALVRGRSAKLKEMTNDDYSAAVQTGFIALAEGLDSLEAALHALRSIPGSPQDGPQARYGVLYRWLAGSTGQRPEFADFSMVFREHVLATWPTEEHEKFLGQMVVGARVHTVATAAREWNIPARTLRKALAARGLVGVAGAKTLDLVETFRADDASDILEGLSKSISRQKAMARLGVNRSQMELLEASNLLPPVRHGDRVKPLQSSVAIDDLLAKVEASVTGMVDQQDAEWLSISSIRRRMSLDFITLLQLLIDGKIADVRKETGPIGLNAIRLRQDDVAVALGKPPLSNMMNRAEVLRIVQISSESLSAVEALDYLTFRNISLGKGLHRRPLCDRDTVERFDAEFVSTSKLSTEWGLSAKSVSDLLSRQNLEPTIISAKGHALFWRRSEIIRLTNLKAVSDRS